MSGLPRVQAAVRRRLADDRFLIVGLLLLFAASTILWDWRYRHGQPYDIDESGYLSISLADFHSLGGGGLISWIKQVEAPSTQSPLTTLLSTPFYLVFGPKALAGLLSPLVYMLVAIAATYGLARRILPRPAAWIAVVLVASTPLVINYSRDYIFAAAATGVVAVALLCFERSDQLRSFRWSLLFGIAVGLLPLARTMTVAFLPAFGIVVLLAVTLHPERARRGLNAAIAVVAAVVTAASWLAFNGNGTLVWNYLTQYGYGAASHEYGVQHSLLSYQAWLATLRSFAFYVYLPHLILFTLGHRDYGGAGRASTSSAVGRMALLGGIAPPAGAFCSADRRGLHGPLLVGQQRRRVLRPARRSAVPRVRLGTLAGVRAASHGLRLAWCHPGAVRGAAVASGQLAAVRELAVTLPQLGETIVASGQGVIQVYEASGAPGNNTNAGVLADRSGLGHSQPADG